MHLLSNTKKEHRLMYLMSPSFIALTYLCLSLGFGAISLANDLGFEKNYVSFYRRSTGNLNIINAYFLTCDCLIYYSLFRYVKKFKIPDDGAVIKEIISKKTVLIAVSMFLLFSAVDIKLEFLGGDGTFSYMPRLVSTVFIILYVSRFNLPLRLFFYGLVMAIFTMTEFESKRQLLFVLLFIMWCEFIFHPVKIRINLKTALLVTTGVGIFTYFIIVSSILRGYGGYEAQNFRQANDRIFDYINTDIFKNASVTNFEVNALYGNSAYAMQLVLSGKTDFLFGSTFFKVLFLPFPKDVIAIKPKAMIDIYTKMADPGEYSKGVSYPIILYSELFWNFWFLGLPMLFWIYSFFNKSYLKVYRNIRIGDISFYTVSVVFLYVTFIQFVRGSGLHLWVLYYLVAIPFIYILVSRKRNGNRMKHFQNPYISSVNVRS
jgi:hypothetical protein